MHKVFEPTHAVYGLTGVTSIPLDYDGAKIALNTLASRNTSVSRPSLLPSATADSIIVDPQVHDNADSSNPSGQRVQFATTDDIKVLSPTIPQFDTPDMRPPSPASSESSLNSLSDSSASSPVAKVLASRLSFWNRLSKRPAQIASASTDPAELDSLVEESEKEPSVILGNILAATAPPPATTEEKHSELEVKIVRECVREFTKGGMYFAYNFGEIITGFILFFLYAELLIDITRSLQHKQDQRKKSNRQSALFADLTSDNGAPLTGDNVDPLAEPYPTLPLWRRVDRQFWWNEWLSKHFIDAGVCLISFSVLNSLFKSVISCIHTFCQSCKATTRFRLSTSLQTQRCRKKKPM